MALRHSGRLELTWTNKDKTLLAHEDGSYEWVDPADYRVNEVRLLHEIGTVGDDQSDNLLIRGDALHALTALNRLPHLAKKYAGRVKLVYIDPPFPRKLACWRLGCGSDVEPGPGDVEARPFAA